MRCACPIVRYVVSFSVIECPIVKLVVSIVKLVVLIVQLGVSDREVRVSYSGM